MSDGKSRLTARLVHHVKDKLFTFILHLENTQMEIISGFTETSLNVCLTAHPELLQQQVEDLSRRHGAVHSYVGDRAVGWSKYRCLHAEESTQH